MCVHACNARESPYLGVSQYAEQLTVSERSERESAPVAAARGSSGVTRRRSSTLRLRRVKGGGAPPPQPLRARRLREVIWSRPVAVSEVEGEVAEAAEAQQRVAERRDAAAAGDAVPQREARDALGGYERAEQREHAAGSHLGPHVERAQRWERRSRARERVDGSFIEGASGELQVLHGSAKVGRYAHRRGAPHAGATGCSKDIPSSARGSIPTRRVRSTRCRRVVEMRHKDRLESCEAPERAEERSAAQWGSEGCSSNDMLRLRRPVRASSADVSALALVTCSSRCRPVRCGRECRARGISSSALYGMWTIVRLRRLPDKRARLAMKSERWAESTGRLSWAVPGGLKGGAQTQ